MYLKPPTRSVRLRHLKSKTVAVKRFEDVELTQTFIKKALTEISIAAAYQHPNIVSFYGVAILLPNLVHFHG
jgi:hypothetical protein